MPKLKTKKSVAKRFKINKKGKIKRAKAYRSHICARKSSKRRRSLRLKERVRETDSRKIRKQLPYG